MSTPNFKTMKDFPLFVMPTPYCKVCPECGFTCGEDEDKCPECEADISDVNAGYDELADADNVNNMQTVAERLNKELDFFKVTVESGYYSGLQFFVDSDKDSPEEMDNEDCQYYFGKCRSKAIRACNSEIRRINKWLVKQGEELGLTELICIGVFSNGEAVYSKVKNHTPTLRQLVKKVA